MLLLLPPSETKRAGGEGAPLDVDALALPALRPQRLEAIEALVALSDDEDAAARALKLSERQRGEIAVNREVRTAPTMPAIDRFTGVLFDALDAASLDPDARAWLGAHAHIQTALLGLVGAMDPIPPFRLSATNRLPGIAPLKRHWAQVASEALRDADPSFVVDLRSESYRDLAPVPGGVPSVYVRVVAQSADGTVRALNHFNKKTKGAFVRGLARRGASADSLEELVRLAQEAGFAMRPAEAPGEILLVSEG